MKLYTEKEVKKMLEDTWAFNTATVQELLEDMPHVEFPTEEEIAKEASKSGISISQRAFKIGAMWMSLKIQGWNLL